MGCKAIGSFRITQQDAILHARHPRIFTPRSGDSLYSGHTHDGRHVSLPEVTVQARHAAIWNVTRRCHGDRRTTLTLPPATTHTELHTHRHLSNASWPVQDMTDAAEHRKH
ncbi:hypothetical protein E2C01_007770 [Portunus trituberculatus]|uniref:Uncharacterized protein n=1 Tax=Portunus trituberculatus TaxID=210409 RepID=A0A5B7CZV9_PORTR|nr:hypothetical protein [Portunus trituberculatus]